MKKRCKMLISLVLCAMLLAALLPLQQVQAMDVAPAQNETNVYNLAEEIAALPEVSDPMGTEYYFYNQLSDVEKVIYWAISEATLDVPEFYLEKDPAYTPDQLFDMAQLAIIALMADHPEYHLYWRRMVTVIDSGDCYTFLLEKMPAITQYHIDKAQARIQHIVDTIGLDGDLYSRTRELLELMYCDMDYNGDLVVRPVAIVDYDDSALGCLLHNVAVCGGFSDTVKLLCDALNIPCITVHSSGAGAHGWNYVRLENNQWYAIDASRDEPIPLFRGNDYLADQSSEPCLVALLKVADELAFPVLSNEQYEYQGDYQAIYQDAEYQFAEKAPRFIYRVNPDGVSCTITAYEGIQSGDLIIPQTIDGYTVTAIGSCAFARSYGFTGDLVIPDSVVRIEAGAFYQCKELEGSLTLSDNLTSLAEYAFLGCEKLSGELDLPSKLDRISDGAFIRCKGFSGDVHLPELDILGNSVFDYCYGLNGTLYLADGVPWSETAFGDTNFSAIEVSDTNENYATEEGILYSKDKTRLIACPTGRSGGIVIPDGVEIIGRCAFETCTQMTGTLTLPDSLLRIEESAFFQAGFTGELMIPDSVTYIGQSAFFGTKFTGDLILPDSIVEIASGAFMDSTFDGVLKLPENLAVIRSSTFCYTPFSGDLKIPDSVSGIEECAFLGCRFGGDLILPDNLTYIGADALAGSSSTYDTLAFSTVVDLTGTEIQIAEGAFRYTNFLDFRCSCNAGCYEEIVQEVNCVQNGQKRIICNHCCGSTLIETPAMGHTEDILPGMAATCTEDGLTEGKYCSVCGWLLIEQSVIPAKGHSYETVVYEPTCLEDGYTIYTCACGACYVDDYILATDHIFEKGICRWCGIEEITHIPGDINGDGSVNNKDLTRLFQYLSGWDVDVVEATLDINGDGKVNNKDLTRLFQYLSDWDVEIV